MSGQRVIIIIAAGVLLVAAVTLALYFLTRQDESDEDAPGFNAQVEHFAPTSALTLPAVTIVT